MSLALWTGQASFEAARQLQHDSRDMLRRMHGHSFKVQVRAPWSNTEATQFFSQALEQAAAIYNYRNLNDLMPCSDDLSIAEQLLVKLPFAHDLYLSSAPNRALWLDAQKNHLYLWSDTFEAAHHLPHVPLGHKCGRLHGHTFGITLAFEHDNGELESLWAKLKQTLNQHYLNDIPGLENPTSEMLAQFIYQTLKHPDLAWVLVRETHSAGSLFDGKTFTIWKEQMFESARSIDQQGLYSGHSYIVRLILQGNLDQTMGWLLDFGDVKTRFKPLYELLDHHPLNHLEDLDQDHSLGVAQWVAQHLQPQIDSLARVDLIAGPHEGVNLCINDSSLQPMLYNKTF